MELVSLAEFMPEQSDGAIGERFESLAIRERPVTIVAFYTQFARVDLHPGVEIDRQFIHVRCNAADESPCVLCDLGDPRKSYHVTPVYAVADAAVRALVISDAHQPHSLGPQYKDELIEGRPRQTLPVHLARLCEIHDHQPPRQGRAGDGRARHQEIS